MNADERYEVRRDDAERALKTLSVLVEEQTPDGMGFVVLLFDFGADGSLFYISDAERSDVVKMMKEFIVKMEGGRL